MPYLSLPSRRSFLAGAFAGAAALRGAGSSVRWAFLSDTHTPEDPANEYRGFRPYDNLDRVVKEISKASPSGAVVTGDLARLRGLPGDYRNLRSLLNPLTHEMPVAMALGNHDDRDNFLAAFPEQPGEPHDIKDKHVLTLDAGPARFILLDSRTGTNITPGLLGKKQRTWLDAYLKAAAPKPTLVFVHHTLNDGDNSLLDMLWMLRVLRPHKMVKAVVYGHSHQYSFTEDDGIHLINLPAVGYNFSDEVPVGWVETTLNTGGADFRLRAIGGNTAADGVTTTVKWRNG